MPGLDDFKVVDISDLAEKPTNCTVMTKEEWMTKGRELFGPDMMKWRFVCPGCGNIQAVEDFAKYKERGASPDSATKECIGRYEKGRSWSFEKSGKPCDYAGYGLINICPVKVIDGDKEIWAFAFDEE